jgi:hypothetical protein
MKSFKIWTSYAIACIGATLLMQACSNEPEWTAFFYPDIDSIPGPLDTAKYSFGKFRDFETCQEAAISKVRYHLTVTGQQGVHQCGFKCTTRQDFGGALVCKEIKK